MMVHWLMPGRHSNIQDLYNSNLASIRMRIGLVADFANEININFSAGDIIPIQADVILIGKIGADCKNGRDVLWIEQLKKAKKNSKKIILDYTDHHLANTNSPMRDFYNEAVMVCSDVVVSSKLMKTLLMDYYDGEISVIEDPIEIEIVKPSRQRNREIFSFLWFGHGSNISFLIDYLNNEFLCNANFNLIALTDSFGVKSLISNNDKFKNRITVYPSIWSINGMRNSAEIVDACMIPSGFKSSNKIGASSNRLITAFALGLPVSADLLDSYADYSNYFHDISGGPISEFMADITKFENKLIMAQQEVVPNFKRENLIKKWESVIKSK